MNAAHERDAWRRVWNERDAPRTDWNGYEACFKTLTEYEAFTVDLTALIVAELRIGSLDSVTDLGCGSGRVAYGVACHAQQVKAFDFSQPALAVAQEKRSAPNITYQWADLHDVPLDEIPAAGKAYAVGSFMYLADKDHVWRLTDGLLARGTELLLLDMPDADIADERPRDYDTGEFKHLTFRESDFTSRYADAQILRGRLPAYVNDAVRFGVHLSPPNAINGQ